MIPLGDRRVRVRFEVVGTLHGVLEFSEPPRVLNLSAGGALIKTPLPLPIGSLQTIYLNVDGRMSRVTGEVRRVTRLEAESAYAVGVAFVSPSPTAAASLEVLLEAQSDT
jgi:hypothetical protein